jgi:hypothetical protein
VQKNNTAAHKSGTVLAEILKLKSCDTRLLIIYEPCQVKDHAPVPVTLPAKMPVVSPAFRFMAKNINAEKFCVPCCSRVSDMKEKNKKEYTGNRDDLINQGYAASKCCSP